MTEQIMIHQGKRAKKTKRVLRYVDMVVEVGETLSSREILYRMNSRTNLPTKKGTIPAYYIPRSTTSLGMRLKISSSYDKLPKTQGDKTHYIWRRVE